MNERMKRSTLQKKDSLQLWNLDMLVIEHLRIQKNPEKQFPSKSLPRDSHDGYFDVFAYIIKITLYIHFFSQHFIMRISPLFNYF